MKTTVIIFSYIVLLSACKPQAANTWVPIVQTDSPTVFYSSKGQPEPGAMYPRLIQLEKYAAGKGNILATFEKYVNNEPVFPIYQSTDTGKSWSLLSTVADTRNHYGMRYQPQLFEVPQDIPGITAGTILCAGSSIPKDLSSTELLLYKSADGGKSWEYMSSIIKGGGAGPTIPLSADASQNQGSPGRLNKPVWEPFLQLDNNGKLICYYSDESFKSDGYNQLLAHKFSTDGGKTWSEAVSDVAVNDGIKRPGMIVTAKLPNGKYIMVYEVVGIDKNPVYCRFSDDGSNWGDPKDLGSRIVDSSNGFFMSGTPYIVWSPAGGVNGTLVVSAKGSIQNGEMIGNGLMINKNLGKGSWQFQKTVVNYNAKLHPGGYSRSMIPVEGGKKILQLTPVPENGNQTSIYQSFETIAE